MSYSIMYNSIFIKSCKGLTVATLSGDNNVWSPVGNRRARDWGIFNSVPGVSESEFLAVVQKMIDSGYNEFWYRNGKFVDAKGLKRWAENGVKNAACLEDILAYNKMSYATCYVETYGPRNSKDKHFRRELQQDIRTTAEFDVWISAVYDTVAACGNNYGVYPVVSFHKEDVKQPKPANTDTNTRYLIKAGKSYLTSYTNTSSNWANDVKQAMEMSYDEALMFVNAGASHKPMKMVNSRTKLAPWNVVIVAEKGGVCSFVYMVSSSRVRLTANKPSAKKYKDESSATRAMKNVENLLSKNGYNCSIATM